MASVSDWKVPAAVQPKASDYSYDLEAALSAVVGVRAIIPPDAFTADTLGTERAGNGVLIRSDGLVLTIGYLVTEAETIWLSLIDGRNVPGTVLAYDQTTGFVLVIGIAIGFEQCADQRPQPRARRKAAVHGAGRIDQFLQVLAQDVEQQRVLAGIVMV